MFPEIAGRIFRIKGKCNVPPFTAGFSRLPENSLNWLLLCGWGRRPSSQQADDPGRAIEIVALTGQLYATDSKRPIATACATQKVPRSAVFGGRSSFIPGRYSGLADVGPSAEPSYEYCDRMHQEGAAQTKPPQRWPHWSAKAAQQATAKFKLSHL